ncbi:glycosyltransferase [Peteryoungia algae]|uniref:Glycosyltransferase n=1 Tax=Peteryoungia algae TaxID=2919917 RepID=A0ABT0D002_9HYPH|nr:glycosyltransferase [Rhizobium sp. SSM4.3]MCJ8238710.1 glycosyltransferase [Rhizobium sp. SSM4.3]
MTLFIQASNVHQGGGKALLLPLLAAVRQPCVVYLDERLGDVPDLDPAVKVMRFKATLPGRLKAERTLRNMATSDDLILCFGNLPPLFPSRAKVVVFLQNRYLATRASTVGMPVRTRVRINLERLWLGACLRAATLIVQTETMARAVELNMKRRALPMPFFPTLQPVGHKSKEPDYDFVYVASGEPHKNHRTLVEAWEILHRHGFQPTLCLTLTFDRDRELRAWVERRAQLPGLSIDMQDVSGEAEVARLLARSRAAIYPSHFESFGLPLLEAKNAGLPIIASERDYVRDLVEPVETFDPDSALSIARAVMRHLGKPMKTASIDDPVEFLRAIQADF